MEDGNAVRKLDDPTPNPSATPSTPKPKLELAKPPAQQSATGLDRTKAAHAKVEGIQNATSQKLINATGTLDKIMQRILRVEDPGTPEPQPLLIPPKGLINSVGDVADALALTPARRILEITNSTGGAARAAYRTITRPLPLFHFWNTLGHPLKYLANPARVATSTTNTVANIANAIPASIDEVVNRGIKRPLERLENIPLIGGILSKTGKAAGWAAKLISRPTGWFQKITKKADSYVASKQ